MHHIETTVSSDLPSKEAQPQVYSGNPEMPHPFATGVCVAVSNTSEVSVLCRLTFISAKISFKRPQMVS